MSDDSQFIKVLLIEDNEDDYLLTRQHLPSHIGEITWAQSLAEADGLLKTQKFDVILVDLGLPDSQGLSTYDQLMLATEDVPTVIVLTGNDDDDLAKQSLLRGAQDYLLKGRQMNAEVLRRSINYAMERHKIGLQLRQSNNDLIELNSKLVSMNEQLTEARDEALTANRLKTEFLANVSHEIRTPLSGIATVADLLLLEECSEEVAQLHGILDTSSKRLTRIVNDILDISKLEAGRVAAVLADCNVHEVITDVVATVEPTARRKRIALKYDIDASVPTMIISDEVKLRQILLNLVHNAVKFTEQGSVTVSAKVEAESLILKVVDTGIGIPKKYHEQIFHPFVQGDGSTTRKYEGTGLGLAIVQKSVALLGGQVGVQSQEDGGSTFEVKFAI